jgi:hypothetical protein
MKCSLCPVNVAWHSAPWVFSSCTLMYHTCSLALWVDKASLCPLLPVHKTARGRDKVGRGRRGDAPLSSSSSLGCHTPCFVHKVGSRQEACFSLDFTSPYNVTFAWCHFLRRQPSLHCCLSEKPVPLGPHKALHDSACFPLEDFVLSAVLLFISLSHARFF